MDLINEQHIAFFQRRKQACQVTRLVENRTGRNLKVDTQLGSHDMSQGGLSQARRAMK